MNKKYLPSALILYLNYFIHGVGCSILGQAVIKEALAASWGVEAMAITAISAALGLGIFGSGTIGIAAAVAFQYFGMKKVMVQIDNAVYHHDRDF